MTFDEPKIPQHKKHAVEAIIKDVIFDTLRPRVVRVESFDAISCLVRGEGLPEDFEETFKLLGEEFVAIDPGAKIESDRSVTLSHYDHDLAISTNVTYDKFRKSIFVGVNY